MRSTNIVLFLVLLNVSVAIVAAAAPVSVTPDVGGDSEISSTQDNIEQRETNRPGSDGLVGAFFGLGSLIEQLRNIVFYGPEMFANLGVPRVITTGFQVVVGFVVAFDVAEAITGRILS